MTNEQAARPGAWLLVSGNHRSVYILLFSVSPLEEVYQALLRRGFDPDAVHDAMVSILTKGIDTIDHLDYYARQAAFFAFLRAKRRGRREVPHANGEIGTGISAPAQLILAELSEVPLDLVQLAAQPSRTKGQQSRLWRWRQKTTSQGDGGRGKQNEQTT